MVKEPIGGRCKTRLAAQVGLSRAISFYRHTTAAVLARVGSDPRWQTLLAVAPDSALAARAWPRPLARMPQGAGDLGQRMQAIFARAPAGPVLIIGSDIPGVTAARIAKAFRRLRDADAVFGPARDGGYWLVGQRRMPHVLSFFAGVRWSSRHTLADSKAALAGRRVAEADTLADVDDGDELAAWRGGFGRRVLAAAQ